MAYLVIYRTATHVSYTVYETEVAARDDEHLAPGWCGILYKIVDPDGFTQAEAKDLYHRGVEAMAPGWGITELAP